MKDIGLKHWIEQSKKYGKAYHVSWEDFYMIHLEIERISEAIMEVDKRERVLDVGCGNGYSTDHIRSYTMACSNRPNMFVGIDYCGDLVNIAKKSYSNDNANVKYQFFNGDALGLWFEDEAFDIVYTTRCLINILTWEDQKIAIDECLRVTKRGGRVIFSEAFWEPLQKLNALRSMVRLPPLRMHDFNRYLYIDKLCDFLEEKGLNYKIEDFSSLYYLGSRVLREIVTPAQDNDFRGPMNQLFSDIEKKYNAGVLGIGIQNLVVIDK